MKRRKTTLLMLGALALALPLFGQDGGGMGGPGFGDGPHMMGPGDFEIPEDLVALREEVIAARDQLFISRAAALETLAEDATLAERRQVLDAWRAENADLIAELETLTAEFRAEMEALRPDGPLFPNRPEIPEEVRTMRQELVAQRQALRESRQAVLDGLDEGATREEIAAALEAWRAENAEAIRSAHELAQQVRNWFRENRPQRPDRPGDGLDAERMRLREHAQQLRQQRQELAQQLENASEEERMEILRQFREQQRDLMREYRELKRQERLGDGSTGGDRRPGTGG